MKAECVRDRLAETLQKAERIAGKNLTLPVLKCFLIEAKDDVLTIKATNLDIGIELSIPAKIIESGEIAVPASIFNSFVQNLHSEKNISLETIEGNLRISTKTNATTIKALPHEEYPIIPRIAEGKTFEMHTKEFSKGLQAVWYAASTTSIKPELSSIFIYNDEDTVVFAATDSFRLAEKRVKVKKPKDFTQILLPYKNVPDIVRILDSVNDDIEVRLDKTQISFSYKGLYLVSRVVDGIFPDYKQIIPREFKTEAVVLKQDLMSALKLANVFSDTFNQVNMKVMMDTKKFQIRTRNSDVGENTNSIDAVLTGDDIEINFNHKYIVDCFQSIEADSISLQFNAMNRPVVVRGVSDKSFLYLVMPMNK